MKIAFISTKNAVRSIMAEAVAKKFSRLALISPDIHSAGISPAQDVPDEVINLLTERGYSVEGLHPKDISAIPYEEMDILITLSPEARDHCPYSINHMRREHWVLEEAKSLRREELEKLLEQIENLVKGLFKIS